MHMHKRTLQCGQNFTETHLELFVRLATKAHEMAQQTIVPNLVHYFGCVMNIRKYVRISRTRDPLIRPAKIIIRENQVSRNKHLITSTK